MQIDLPVKTKTPLTVTQLTAGIKKLLEQNYASIEVAGEVSRLTRQSSGHIYFTIKDAHASISAVIWRSTALRLKLQPKEGEAFLFSGSISVYE
ncbi:MAG TPA: exodeoxyribonuclease VII large subunit, partial [Mariprofundaceae bacterium]|nr:exodeoxyribonuclease VII large subunit [Mariprofundaceae bacterium]